MKQYNFSVITPYHNTDLKAFKKSCDSILKQTIKFNNIQYIIVFHNTKASIIKDVKKLIGNHSNVIYKELINNNHSPSSPRNLGLKYATGEYLCFLDSDDYLSYDCLERVYKHMKTSRSEITSVRRAIDLEFPNLPIFGLLFLWNNVEKEIIVHRNNWDQYRMFSGHTCYPVTSCFFKRKLIMDYNIRFDETIVYGEDILFNLRSYSKAQIVSYLPQMIGYNYFMHTGSILQTVDRPREFVLEMAKGAVKIFDETIAMGIDPTDVLNNLLFDLSRAVIFSSTLTEEDRYIIKDLVEKYVAMQQPMKVSKVNDPELVFIAYYMPRLAFLYPDAMKNKHYRKLFFNDVATLLHVMNFNKDTDFGQKYHFKDIKTIEAFQSLVPVTTMKDYTPLVELQTKVAESGIISALPPYLYLCTDKEHSNEKLPFTQMTMSQLCELLTKILDQHYSLYLSEQGAEPMLFNDHTSIYTLAKALLREYILSSDKQYGRLRGNLVIPYSLSTVEHSLSHDDYIYSLALFMLKNKNFDQIVTTNSIIVNEVFDYINIYRDKLIKDIATGTSHLKEDAPSYYEELKLYHRANKERAAEIKTILHGGLNKKSVHAIWPHLNQLIIIGEKNSTRYLYSKYLDSKSVKEVTPFIISLPGLVGVMSKQPHLYNLPFGANFYEFMPLKKDAKPLLITEIKAGVKYRLIVTNHNGLYRYLTDIKIQVVTINPKVFEYKIVE